MNGKMRTGLLFVILLLIGSGLRPDVLLAEATTQEAGDTVYTFDMSVFLAGKDQQAAYDYLKIASALQGLVNREKPQLFFFYESGPLANDSGMDMDRYWLEELRKQGHYLSDFNLVAETDFQQLLDRFRGYTQGLVVWDGTVAATSNVASTIAGADNLLPVRYDPQASSVYNEMLTWGFQPEVDLVGKFTGQGMIPGSTQPSTGSKKNDAYLWAKMNYLDTGKTNPVLMEYALDAASWHNQLGDNNAHVYSIYLPDTIRAGEEADVAITFTNTGTTTWSKNSNFRLASVRTGAGSVNQFVWDSQDGGSFGDPAEQRVNMTVQNQTTPGERYTFRLKLIAPNKPGKYVLAARMVREGIAWMGDYIYKTIEVTGIGTGCAPATSSGSTQHIVKDNDAEWIAYDIPEEIAAGKRAAVSITFENTGLHTWNKAGLVRLGSTWTEDGDNNRFVWDSITGGQFGDPSNQRVEMMACENVLTGGRSTFNFTVIAPSAPGEYTFWARMVRDGVTWMGDIVKLKIRVITSNEVPVQEEVVGEAYYPDLLSMLLPNADYYIANKAFFFDLSPDPLVTPNDDRNQPLGTDYATLIQLLQAQRGQAGNDLITIGGFVPWQTKYTDAVAPPPLMRMNAIEAEWSFVDIVSKYYAQLDADVGALGSLANASVYAHVPLSTSLTQKNDKGANNTTGLTPGKKYLVFYMSDFDSAAWLSGTLPSLWDDPARGQLPLAWSFATDLSKRAPHVFNYIYDTMTAKDYFVSGDNGTGYLNPMMLEGSAVPSSMSPMLSQWEAYNKLSFERFDLDITGFLISGNSQSLTSTVQEAYSRVSPVGVGTNGGYPQREVNGTPFTEVVTIGNEETNAAWFGQRLAQDLSGGSQFRIYRTLLTKPSVLVDAVNYVKTHYPQIDFEVVDPYTYFKLYKAGGS